MSFDGGETNVSVEREQLSGTYFFLSNDRMEHSRVAFSFIQLLAEVGGLIGMLYIIVEYIGVSINEYVIITNIVEKLYFEFEGCYLNTVSLSLLQRVRHIISCKKKNK